MQDQKLALLIALVVVFVVLATLLIFLIYRFGKHRCVCFWKTKKTTDTLYVDRITSTKHDLHEAGKDAFGDLYRGDPRIYPSTHLLYFLDFQGELHWINFKKKPASKIDTESAMQQHIFHTLRPTTGEGNGAFPLIPEMLALSYVTDYQTLVVMDLDRLLARDTDFGARMLHTAARPLLLSCLREGDANGTVFTALSRHGYTVGGAAVTPATPRSIQYSGRDAGTSPEPNQQKIEVDLRKYHMNPMSKAPAIAVSSAQTDIAPPTGPPPLSSRSLPPTNVSTTGMLDTSGMAPTPVIHPFNTHRITTTTLVSVTAASYTVLHSSGSRTALDTANTATIEAARLQWNRRQSLVVPLLSGVLSGCTCVIDPVTEEAALLTSSVANPAHLGKREPIVCERADALYYTIERMNSTMWLPFDRPFCLPAGRWCVRARDVLYRDDSSKTVATVFTVNAL